MSSTLKAGAQRPANLQQNDSCPDQKNNTIRRQSKQGFLHVHRGPQGRSVEQAPVCGTYAARLDAGKPELRREVGAAARPVGHRVCRMILLVHVDSEYASVSG